MTFKAKATTPKTKNKTKNYTSSTCFTHLPISSLSFLTSRELSVWYQTSCSLRRCWSYVGRTGKKQQLSLARGCWGKGTIIHEIGKATVNISSLNLLFSKMRIKIQLSGFMSPQFNCPANTLQRKTFTSTFFFSADHLVPSMPCKKKETEEGEKAKKNKIK